MTQLARVQGAEMDHHVDGRMSFDDMVAMGDRLVKTGFLPEHIKNGAQAAAIILTGRELGMPMMRSLRSLAMVKGKVVEYADSQLSRFKAEGGRARFVQLTTTTAELHLRHPNGDEHTETYTIDDAKKSGVAMAMYDKHPKAMLRSRAITSGLKSLGWEGGVGAYDPGEAEEFAPQQRTATVIRDTIPADEPGIADALLAEIHAAVDEATLKKIATRIKGASIDDGAKDALRKAYSDRRATIAAGATHDGEIPAEATAAQ